MLLLDGKKVAFFHRKILVERITEFSKQANRAPGLAVVLVGDDPASQVYVRNKEKACGEVGICSFRYNLENTVAETELLTLIEKLNGDPQVDAILVQLPLPPHLNTERILAALDPAKDADGLCPENLGLLWGGRPRVIPCTPHGIIKIFAHYEIALMGKRAVVVGRSQIVGKPMAQLLLEAHATVTICHSKTQDLEAHTREADIVVVATGRPREFGRNMFKQGSVVVDVGIHRSPVGSPARLCGDVRSEELEDWAYAATPVPGGVGPMTITMLLENTTHLAELRCLPGF